MDASNDLLSEIRAINDSAAFNRWCGIQVERAEPGSVEIAMHGERSVASTPAFSMRASSARSSTRLAASQR